MIVSDHVYILSFARTPFCRVRCGHGKLSGYSATELAAHAVRAAIERAGLSQHTDEIKELFFGTVCSGHIGQSPADQVARLSNLTVPATHINKVCSSSLKAVSLAALSARLSPGVWVAVGAESMSQAFLTADSRPQFPDDCRTSVSCESAASLLHRDGLIDAASGFSMGDLADAMAEDEGITQQEQDEYTIRSVLRASRARQSGSTAWERVDFGGIDDDLIASYEAKARDAAGDSRMPALEEALRELARERRPCFRTDLPSSQRTVTSFNSSGLSDGAAALLVANEETVRRLREFGAPPPLAEIVGCADAAVDPTHYCVAPSDAVASLLSNYRVGLTLHEISCVVLNEAFAAVALANCRRLGLSDEERDARVNQTGDALALGHPLGASGIRCVGSLISALRQVEDGSDDERLGVAALCNGGGGASAILLRLVADRNIV